VRGAWSDGGSGSEKAGGAGRGSDDKVATDGRRMAALRPPARVASVGP